MKKNTCELIFTGDIMCCLPQNGACRTPHGYDYKPVFKAVREYLTSADYCVGNLETPFAGEDAGYTSEFYSFNTPDEFAAAVKEAGFHLVSTANNHCLDRGVKGLKRTLDALDEAGLAHLGTARSKQEREQTFVRDINGIKIGFVAYTYGTNAFANNTFLKDNEQYAVNLFQPQETLPGMVHLLDKYPVIAENVKKIYNTPNNPAAPYLEQLKNDIANCRQAGADYVIVLMHSGSQNIVPTEKYTEHLVKSLKQMGADAIIGNHQHVVQKFQCRKGIPVFYCLGNFATTPWDSPASKKSPLSTTSVTVKMQLKKVGSKVRVKELTFRLTRSITHKNGQSVVVPMFELIRDCRDTDEQKQLLTDYRKVVNNFLNRPPETPVIPIQEHKIELF